MRSYGVAAVAFATKCDPKWIDNLLSHRAVRGTSGGQRGVMRRIEPEGAVLIAIVRALTSSLGISIERALELAEQTMDAEQSSIIVATGVTLIVDTVHLRQAVEKRLDEAMEVIVQPRRGRPPVAAGRTPNSD
jgi:hypothetical protein